MKILKILMLHITSGFLNFLSKFVLGYVMPFKLNVHYKNLKAVYGTRGPFVFLPNHTNQWDPFMICLPTLRVIHWVASDAAFRDSFKKLLLASGTIPKVKEQSDMITLQALQEAIKMRHPVGIFPEGEQNWDGGTSELIPATAKLIRFLKVPVVVPIIKGGYLTKPRWSWNVRPCRIDVHFTRIIDRDEIKTMKLAEIERRINEALDYDEYEWQKENMVPIRSEIRAEHMELIHYLCPSCEEIGGLKSKGNTLACSCGYTVEVDRYGFFQYPEAGPSFESPRDWVKWQNALLVDKVKDKLDAAANGGEADPVLMSDSDITLMKGERAMPMVALHKGEARLYRDRIEFGDPGTEIMIFPLNETTAANTFKQQRFEFRYEKAQYRFQPPTRSISGYKWEKAYKGLRALLVERGEW